MMCHDVKLKVKEFTGADGGREVIGTIRFDYLSTDTIDSLMYALMDDKLGEFDSPCIEVSFKVEHP
jgi:hypothetical protein